MRRRTAVPCLVALSSAIVFASPGPPARAACEQPPCRAYLPLAGGRLRLDLGEYGSEGPSWQPLGMHDRVLDLAYDAEGDLWAATLGGLTEWPAAGGEPRVHSHAPISQVAVDGAGAVWFGGFQAAGGVERVEADPLERLLPDGRRQRYTVADGLPAGWLQALAVDDRGRLLASWGPLGEDGPGGLARWEEAAGWRVWEAEAFTGGGGPWAMAADGRGGMWLAGGTLHRTTGAIVGSWLRRVDADGRLGALEPMLDPMEGLLIIRLAFGAGGKLFAIAVAAEQQQNSRAGRRRPAPAGVDPDAQGFGRLALDRQGHLAVRSPAGDWTILDLPLEDIDAARREPQFFVNGPGEAVVDSAGRLWLQFDGVLMSLAPDGSTRFVSGRSTGPSADPSGDDLDALLWSEPVLAAGPGGVLALGSRRTRGVAVVAAAASAKPRWLGSREALPGRISSLRPGAGGLFAQGDDQGERRLWFKPPGDAGWASIDGRDPEGEPGLSAIAVSPGGEVWIGDGDRVIRAGADRRRLEVIGPGSGLPGGVVTTLAIGKDAAVWVGTEQGLARLSNGGMWTRPDMPADLSPAVADLAVATDGGLWAALAGSDVDGRHRPGGLFHLAADGRSQAWASSQIAGIEAEIGLQGSQFQVALSPDGTVYTQGDFGTSRGDGRRAWEEVPTDGTGRLMVFDRQGRLWTDSTWFLNLARYDPRSGLVELFEIPHLDDAWIGDLVVDPRSGDLWLGFQNQDDGRSGYLQRKENGSWRLLEAAAVHPGARPWDTPLRLAFAPDGSLLSTMSGDHVLVDGRMGRGSWEPQDRLSVRGSVGTAGCVDPVGRYWLPYREGLSGYRPGEGWRHVRSADGLPPQPRAASATCAPDGAVWLVGRGRPGIARWTPSQGLQPLDEAIGIRPGEGALHVAWSPDGRAAVLVTAGGLDSEPAEGLLVGQPGGGFRRHAPSVLAGALATDLAWGPDGRLWVATDRGLALLDARSAGAQPAWVADGAVAGRGLLDLAWRGGRLWAVGFGGAAERLADGRWRPFTKADGLPSDRLRQAAEGPDGALWLVDQPGGVVRLAR